MPAETEEKAAKILIGTSGFSYKEWKGPFYPEKLPDREMLRYYAASFPAVEINSTFYAIPRSENMEIMVKKTEGKLEFVVKAHQDLTHNREKADEALPPFKAALKPLQDHKVLSCVLLQFPYSFHHNLKNRDHLAILGERMEEIPLVAEFRNKWWAQDKTFEFLRKQKIGYCCVDEPLLPGLMPPTAVATSPIGYVRFHGRNKEKWWKHEKAQERYDYLYTEDELKDWVVRIKALLPLVKKIFVFFNNHPRGQAAINALAMVKLMASTKPS
ncbi:MAG: DUF72 domain-containing protein [Nitrospiria bacterium]